MSNYKYDAVIAGTTCLDLTPIFTTKPVENINEILIPAKTLMMGDLDIHAGGCVSNTGMAMHKFGAKVSLMGKVGNDDLGKLIIQQFEDNATSDGMIIDPEGTTAYSLVMAPPGIDRIFLFNPGVNDSFVSDDIDYNVVGQSRLFHFGYPPAMKQLYRNEGTELVELLKKAHDLGTATSMDTTGVDEHAEVGRADWEKIIKSCVPYLDFFVPSVEELCFMIDRPRFREWERRANGADMTTVISPEDVKPLGGILLDWGVKVALIKCGSKGLYLATASEEVIATIGGGLGENLKGWGEVRHFEASFKPAKILSATGAGDTCIAAFLYAVLQGLTWEKSVEYATATGAACVESYDALTELRSFDELQKKIDAGWEKNQI